MACWALAIGGAPPYLLLANHRPTGVTTASECHRLRFNSFSSIIGRRRRRRVVSFHSLHWHWSSSSSSSSRRHSGFIRLIWRSVAVFVITVLSGVVALRLRGVAQAYVESRILPPIACLLGERLGREIQLGRVQGLSPLGVISLRDCSIGPHDEEFSCAQLPNIRIRIKLLRSFQLGQIAADVVLSQPHFLVCQKEDWTWLGLPAPSTAKLAPKMQQPDDQLLDPGSRTNIRRLAKQSTILNQAQERIKCACNSATVGYRLPVFQDEDSHLPAESVVRDVLVSHWKPLHGAKSWVKEHLARPNASSAEKARFQEKNLQLSAAKARSFFNRLSAAGIGGNTLGPDAEKQRPDHQSPVLHVCELTGPENVWENEVQRAITGFRGDDFTLPSHSSSVALTVGESETLSMQTTGGVEESEVSKTFTHHARTDVADNPFAVALESVYIKDGTFMLLAYGDNEPRLMDQLNGRVDLSNNYQTVNVQVTGNPKAWRKTDTSDTYGGFLDVIVHVDVAQQKWDAKVKGYSLFAPLLERLLEVPLDWYQGTVHGEVHAWMDKEDRFPNLGGKVDIKNLSFKIWEAPAAFKEVNGTLFLQGQRAFLHNTTGLYGEIPLSISGDMDLNPENGEYRLSCQVSGIEVNALMNTLKVRPPPFPVAGALKAVLYCRGPLEAPIFEGSAETLKTQTDLALSGPPSMANDCIKQNLHRGATAAYDQVAFSTVSASFTFDTDNCVANVYGIRATPVGGGEIRGAGDIWICPEAETDPTAIRVDCSGHVMLNDIIESYLSNSVEMPLFGAVHGEAKIRGSLLTPTFDIKWVLPDANGSFNGARGDIAISDEAISINSSSFTFDVYAKVSTEHTTEKSKLDRFPKIEGLDMDVRMRGFDMMDLVTPISLLPPDGTQLKVSGRFRFQGRVQDAENGKLSCLAGDLSLANVKLNQLLVASHLTGSLELSRSSFKLSTNGRGRDHLLVQQTDGQRSFFSLQRGQLQVDASHSPHSLAKFEIRNLLLDELELSSLRGVMQKVDVQLNLQKRRGHGCLSVRRPRFSGIHGELLDVSARWSGDVVTLEKSLLEQANSRYELRGEYVFPGSRDKGNAAARVNQTEGMWEKAMAGHLGHVISSLGRWRLRLEVPRAELADMLPVARLLSRSADPAIVTRSKELFLQGVEKAAFLASNLKQEIEFIKTGTTRATRDEGLPDTVPLPGLAELKGRWHGTFEASGGGNSDTTANLDLHGDNWEWGAYNIQNAVAIGSYCYADGLRLDKVFLQKDTATLHADGMLGPDSNLHFALLNFPVELVPPLLQAIRSSSVEPLQSSAQHAPLNGVLHMEGDLRGDCNKPECDVHVRLLDGAIGGINLNRADLAASITSGNQFVFNARLEPVAHAGHVHARGSIPLGPMASHQQSKSRNAVVKKWMNEKNFGDQETKSSDGQSEKATSSDWDFIEAGALYIDVVVKDSGMMLLTAVTPDAKWLQGNADVRMQVRGTFDQPVFDGMATIYKASVSSPMLPRPIFGLGGTVAVKENELLVDNVDGRAGKRGKLVLKGRLPLRASEGHGDGGSIDLKADSLEVRAKHMFSGQVDGQLSVMGSLLEPELTGFVKLSRGELYLSQEKNTRTPAATIPRALSDLELVEEKHERKLPVAVRLKGLKFQFGPELRMVYPLILNFAVNGELELHGFADSERVKPKGVLTFENGDVNLVATQVRLNKDYLNRAKFEPEQGLDPNLDLALVGVHWQLKVQGRAQNWQDSLVLTCARSGEQDTLTRVEAAKLFETQLVDSLLEGNGQFAFKKLAAATVETLMPKIETKGEFGQARWRLVYAPQIPNLLSLDPTTDPFKSLANLSFGTEVEVRLGKHLQASVVRQLKESEMATQWTLIYHLNNKLRLVFSSIPSVDNRLLFEYSASPSS